MNAVYDFSSTGWRVVVRDCDSSEGVRQFGIVVMTVGLLVALLVPLHTLFADLASQNSTFPLCFDCFLRFSEVF